MKDRDGLLEAVGNGQVDSNSLIECLTRTFRIPGGMSFSPDFWANIGNFPFLVILGRFALGYPAIRRLRSLSSDGLMEDRRQLRPGPEACRSSGAV